MAIHHQVILYSGGVDSFIGLHLLGPVEWRPVYFDLHSRYSKKEYEHLRTVMPGVAAHAMPILNLGSTERSDAFIPQRNVLLCTAAQAAFDAHDVALCAVAGEFSRDKHRTFYRRISSLLSYTAGHEVRIFSPLAGMTKTQAVKKYLESGGDAEMLRLRTVSCYDSTMRACGECMSCFRRWVAFENNGIIESEDLGHHVWAWARQNRQPVSDILRVPVTEWPSFLHAQYDVVRAVRSLRRRTTL